MSDRISATDTVIDHDTLQNAYQHTGFDTHVTGAGAEVPISTSVVFETQSSVDPTALKPVLREHGYACIVPDISQTLFASKLYDSETNEFLYAKIRPDAVRIFPKSEEFSFETFARFLAVIETEVTRLVPDFSAPDT